MCDFSENVSVNSVLPCVGFAGWALGRIAFHVLFVVLFIIYFLYR